MLPITPQGVKVNFYTPWCKSFYHSVKILLFEFGFTFFYTLKCKCEVNYYNQMCSFTLAGEKSFTDMCKVPNRIQSSNLQKRNTEHQYDTLWADVIKAVPKFDESESASESACITKIRSVCINIIGSAIRSVCIKKYRSGMRCVCTIIISCA